jgi:hypothetical protein
VTQYETLKITFQQLRAYGLIPTSLSSEERADWAYGTTVIENPKITREIVRRAVEANRAA